MPDAFRSIPIREEDLRNNIVAVKHPKTGQVMYALFYAALFGFESAVYSFGRWSMFLEAMTRRLGALLWSMYVDDGNLVDLEEAECEGQLLTHAIFEACGARLSSEKRISMSAKNDFLGVLHDFVAIPETGAIVFSPRPELLAKM